MPPDFGMSGITNSLTCYGHTEQYWRKALIPSLWVRLTNPYQYNICGTLSTRAEDYWKEVILALTSACNLAAKSIMVAQKHYKDYYDRGTKQVDYHLGGWVLNRFPVVAWTISHCG